MKAWLTARELAALALPDLPDTERGVQIYAERAGWTSSLAHVRKRAGRGGGLEFAIELLPPLARIEYERRHRAIESPAPALAVPMLGTDLTDRAARERDARLAIVRAFEAFGRGQRLSATAQTALFVDGYNAGALQIDAWVREIIPQISVRTLARWRAARAEGRADRLAHDPGAARRGKGVLDLAHGGAVRTFLLALLAHNPHLSAEHLRAQIRYEFGDRLDLGDGKAVDVPPVRTLQHYVARLKETEKVALTKLSDPDRYRGSMAPSGVGSYRWVTEPNTLWMIDASPIDALCVDGRHTIYACIDIATRRLVLYVSRTPRASAVALLLRKSILAWGVPDAVKTDNGSDFVARDTQRLFAALGIEMQLSDPYQPQQKAFVESVIKTFQHDCATLLPGFVGHSVADRKRIEDRKSFAERQGEDTAETFGVALTGAELQAQVDRWVESIYAQRTHSALGLSPALAATRSKRPVRTVDPRALDLLLMPVAGGDGTRTVTKFGVRVDGFHYVVMDALPGDQVLVRMDPADAGRIYAFNVADGRFVGEGVCPELAGIEPAALLAARKSAQAEILSEATREARKAIKEITSGPSLLERALAVAERDMPQNIIAFPRPTEAHETPAIAAALDAMAPKPASTVATLSGRAAELHAEMLQAPPITAAARQNVTPLRVQENRQQRFRRALDLEAKRADGIPLSEEEAFWLGGYAAGSEYRAMRTLYEDGGEAVLA
ncbi:Mu transposase C-terminal domain-containing protein [Blastochloris tepida]|nr:Mu transposase C-terminal domain-containing protein [Blastochloris tepida]